VEKVKKQECTFSCRTRYVRLFKVSLDQLNQN